MQGTLEELRRESFRVALRSVGGDPQLAEWLATSCWPRGPTWWVCTPT